LAADFARFARSLAGPAAPRGFGRGAPLFAVGLSMGGCVALRAALLEVRAAARAFAPVPFMCCACMYRL
jgi:alpha-beta hydrolase superfamily lysophospholipase